MTASRIGFWLVIAWGVFTIAVSIAAHMGWL